MPELWPHIPSAVSEVLEFNTDVRQAPDGEVRDSLKDATQRLTMTFMVRDSEAANLKERYRSNALGEWYLPIWPQASFIAAGAAYLDTTFAVNTDADYRASGLAVILQSYSQAETMTVTSASSGLLTVSAGISQDYAGGASTPTVVAPVLKAICPGGITTQVQNGITQVSTEFIIIEPLDLSATYYTAHSGLPVFGDDLAYRAPLDGAIRQAVDLLDSGFGAYSMESLESYKRARGTLGWAESQDAARWQKLQFLHKMRGRDGAFWLPTGKDDALVSAQVAAAGTSVTLAGFLDAPADWNGRSVQIEYAAGSYIYRALSSYVDVGGNHRFTITAPGVIIPALSKVRLMDKVRFDTDRFQVNHIRTADGWFSDMNAPVIEVAA